MIEWCNNNQGFLMVLLTFVYVVATIAICWFNYSTVREQKKIAEDQKKIDLFTVRNETYGRIVQQLRFWRFMDTRQIEAFIGFENKAEAQMIFAKQTQAFIEVLTQTYMVFGPEVHKLLEQAWEVVSDEIYPRIQQIINGADPSDEGIVIWASITRAARGEEMAPQMQSLFDADVKISQLVRDKIHIFGL